MLVQAREVAGLSQAALAHLARMSQTTLSAYEHGRKSPTLQTAARIVAAVGFDLALSPRIVFRQGPASRGRPIQVPNVLPRLPLDHVLAAVQLPPHLDWSDRGRRYDLRDRLQRDCVYEIALRGGGPDDILTYIDGALLIDPWDELVLPPDVRTAWHAVVTGENAEQVA